MKKLVTVVIPIHMEEPSEWEKISLAQTLRVLGKYPIIFMTRRGLNTRWYQEFCREKKANVGFEEFTWNGIDQFSQLLISPKFYGRFREYDYMLTCHLDAFVFRDELEKWCATGYDYIGSVIYNFFWAADPLPVRPMLGFTKPDYYGNGGFTLRRINTFYRITSRFKLYFKIFYYAQRIRKRSFYEDIFVARLFPNIFPKFRVAPKSIAQQFGAAYEHWDEKNLPFTNKDCKTLPFGAHGWTKYHPEFWIPCIRQCGYEIQDGSVIRGVIL